MKHVIDFTVTIPCINWVPDALIKYFSTGTFTGSNIICSDVNFVCQQSNLYTILYNLWYSTTEIYKALDRIFLYWQEQQSIKTKYVISYSIPYKVLSNFYLKLKFKYASIFPVFEKRSEACVRITIFKLKYPLLIHF